MRENIPEYKYERWAAALEATGRYRVLRRIEPRLDLKIGSFPSSIRRGLIVAAATTGPEPGFDEVLELAMLPFTYCRITARVFATAAPFHGLRQPSRPLPPHLLARVGLTEEDLSGREIGIEEIEPYADEADLVIAHGAAAVRPFAESLSPSFRDRPWACSMTQVPWAADGYDGIGLDRLAMAHGLYGAGRPPDQCHALLEVLMKPRPDSAGSPLQTLLWEARQPSHRIFAEATPFAARAALSQRGYQRHPDNDDGDSTWSIDVYAGQLHQEIRWLHQYVYEYPHPPRIHRLTARTRFTGHWIGDSHPL